tara:strand:+ start:16 stop:594 length:579 start_codon:yes stop_codon:yes gene_type:complete
LIIFVSIIRISSIRVHDAHWSGVLGAGDSYPRIWQHVDEALSADKGCHYIVRLLHLASSIGYGLTEAGIRVKFVAVTALVQSLQRAKEALRLSDALARLDKYAVLIIDDLGHVRKAEQESSVLFELIAHRYERHRLIITSNQDFEHWDKLFEDTIMTIAAIDRLVLHATILQWLGESYRRKASINRQTEHGS